jgi:hypothetical protein
MWVSQPRFRAAHRVFGPRESAEIFTTRFDAHSAIGTMPLQFEQAGFVFTVESAK